MHRLGQPEAVQVVYMTSQDSYEQRVADLVAGKRELFVNVMTDEATEDVVGLSRRSVEALTEALEPQDDNDYRGDGAATTQAQTSSLPTQPTRPTPRRARPRRGPGIHRRPPTWTPESPPRRAGPLPTRRPIAFALAHMRAALGARIERVLVAEGGLIVVVDPVDAAAEAASREASDGVVVVVIDRQAFLALERLGPSSPWAGVRPMPPSSVLLG